LSQENAFGNGAPSSFNTIQYFISGLASGHSHKKKMTVAIVVSFISVIFLLACVCCFLWKKKKWTG